MLFIRNSLSFELITLDRLFGVILFSPNYTYLNEFMLFVQNYYRYTFNFLLNCTQDINRAESVLSLPL